MAVYVTNLESGEATPEQVALLYAQRADTENVFDELKNQWRVLRIRKWNSLILLEETAVVDFQPTQASGSFSHRKLI